MCTWIVALALLTASSEDGPGRPWEKVAPAKGGFSVWMPGKPDRQDKDRKDAAESPDMYFVRFEGSLFIVVSASPFPPEISAQVRQNPKPMLDLMRNAALERFKGKLLEEKPLTFEGHPGREFRAEVSLGDGPRQVMTCRHYLVEKHFVELTVMTPQGDDRSKDAATFFDSFRLTAAQDKENAPWSTFTAVEGRFTVRMPGPPSLPAQGSRGPAGQPRRHRFEAQRDGLSYRVVYWDQPAETPAHDATRLRDDLVRELGGTLASEREIKVEDRPGQEIEIQLPAAAPREPRFVRARLVRAGDRVYEATVEGAAARSQAKEVGAFLTSLHLRGKPVLKQGWHEVTSREGGFAVTMPGAPKTSVHPIRTPEGPKPLHDLSVHIDPTRSFGVAYSDLPGNLPPEQHREAKARGRKRIESVMHAKVLADDPFALDDEHEGWTSAIEVPGHDQSTPLILRTREFLDGSRVFTISVMSPKQGDSPEDAETFLDSFRLLPKN